MSSPPDRLAELLTTRDDRPLTRVERWELESLLRAVGRAAEADEVEQQTAAAAREVAAALGPDTAPVAESEPIAAVAPPAPPPALPPPPPLLPRWMGVVAVAGVLCLLLAVLVPVVAARRATGAEQLCRQRLGRLSFALRLYVDGHSGLYPPMGSDLPALLRASGAAEDDLSCPWGDRYRLNPQLQGIRYDEAARMSRCVQLFEATAGGSPAENHGGRALASFTDGKIGPIDAAAHLSLVELPPAAAAPPTPTPAPGANAPGGLPPSPEAPKPLGPQPASPAAASAPPSAAAPPAAPAPPQATENHDPPDDKHWIAVAEFTGAGLIMTEPFRCGPQTRVRWETNQATGVEGNVRILLTDVAGTNIVKTLVTNGGASGAVDLGAEGTYRLRVQTPMRCMVVVEDRQ